MVTPISKPKFLLSDHYFGDLERIVDLPKKQDSKIFLKTQARNSYKIIFDCDVIMIVAASNYSTIYTTHSGKIFTSKTLKHWEERLNSKDCIRVHASYLVNKRHILEMNKMEKTLILFNGLEAKISKRKLAFINWQTN